MKKLLYIVLAIVISWGAHAQTLRRYAGGSGSTVDTTPLHNQIVANAAALAGKLSSQVGTIADPQDTLYVYGDSYGGLQTAYDGDPTHGFPGYWFDYPHVVASALHTQMRNMSYGGEHIQIWDTTNAGENDPVWHSMHPPPTTPLWAWPHKNSKSGPIIICMGVNDVLHLDKSDTAGYRRDYTRFLDSLTTRCGFTGNDITLCTIPFMTVANKFGTVYDHNIHLYINSTIIPQLAAKYGTHLADVYNLQVAQGAASNMWADSIHVNPTGSRIIGAAILAAIPARSVVNTSQPLAISGTVELGDLILHPHRVVPSGYYNYFHLGLDSSGHVITIPGAVDPTILPTLVNTAGNWIMRGKVAAGDYPTPYDDGNMLAKGGIHADYIRLSGATSTNFNGTGLGPLNVVTYPGLVIAQTDSSTVYFQAANKRNVSAKVNMVFAPTGSMLINTPVAPTDGSLVYANGTIESAALALNNGSTNYALKLNYSGGVSMIDSYNAGTSANVPLSINWHGASTCFNCGFGVSAVASASVQIGGTSQGFLPPKMTNAQRTSIASPAVGLMVYCTDTTEGLYVFTSAGWKMATLQ